MRVVIALILASAAAPSYAATGQDLFQGNCGYCHTVDDTSVSAPTLKGVVGRKIASVPGYAYSDALKAKAGQTWTEGNLNDFLTDPKGWAPGTPMLGWSSDPTDRQAIIDYLKTVH